MSLRCFDLLSCGCAPTVCLATGFVAIFPVLRSPASSGCAGYCGFSSPIWFATFAIGSLLQGRGWCGPRSERRFGLFLFPFWADSSRWSHPLGRDCFRSHFRSECRLFCISLGVVQGLHTHPFAPAASFSVLRDEVTLWVLCVGRFPLVHDRRLSLVLSPMSFRMDFEPLSEASLRALSLPARFLVVLAEAASLREFLTISRVLPYPMTRLHDHLHCT